jgi:hypothetical protein
MKSFFASMVVVCLLSVSAWAQKGKVPITDNFSRVYAIDKMKQDPKTNVTRPAHADGMLGYVILGITKDGQHCLVEYVAAKPGDHDSLKNETSAKADPQMQVWEKGRVSAEVIRAAARAAGFDDIDIGKFGVAAHGPSTGSTQVKDAAATKDVRP